MIPRVPRRYDPLVKFLKETLANKQIGHRVKMAAAMRLSDIYLAHDSAQERREIARERVRVAEAAQAAQAKTVSGTPVQEPGTPQDPEQSAKQFLESLEVITNE